MILEEKKKYLVISDLHIGFENDFASNKIEIGKNSSVNETIAKLKKIIKSENPESIIFLGDIKSSIKRISNAEWKEVPYFFEEMKRYANLILIPGNHDANIQRLIPEDVTVTNSIGFVIDDVLLTHGHASVSYTHLTLPTTPYV